LLGRVIEETVKTYIRQLKTIGIHVQQAIFFGSHASGKNDEWSDIDVAIVSGIDLKTETKFAKSP